MPPKKKSKAKRRKIKTEFCDNECKTDDDCVEWCNDGWTCDDQNTCRPPKKVKKKKKKKSAAKSTPDCIKRSPKQPYDLQRRVLKYINNDSEEYSGIMIVHGTGCGKTLTAAIASQCYLDKYPDSKVVFIGPASLLSNFEKEVENVQPPGDARHMDKYHYFSYDRFLNISKKGEAFDCTDAMLIIDEAHNLRGGYVRSGGYKAKAAMQCAYKARKRLLLTATPFVNNAHDLIVPINILYGRTVAGTKTSSFDLYKISKSLDKETVNGSVTIENLKNLLHGRVDYVPSCRGNEHFPDLKEKYDLVEMGEEFEAAYTAALTGSGAENLNSIDVFTNPRTFLHGYRKAVNKAGSEYYYSLKFSRALTLITKKGKLQQSIIYTNWIEYGVQTLVKVLRRAGYKKGKDFEVFKGGLSSSEKDKIVERYNNSEFPILIMTKAGGEGLDLKGVRNVIILEPVWSDAGIKQIIGRAVRYKSHDHLPKSQRKVKAYKLVLTYPNVTELFPESAMLRTGDQMLYTYVDQKEKMTKIIDKILKEASIKHKKVKPKKINVVDPKQTYLSSSQKSLEAEFKLTSLKKLKDICSLFAIPKSALGDMALSKYKKKDIPKLAKLMAAYIKR